MGLILGLWRERFYNRLRGWPEHVRLISSYNEIREATLFSRKKREYGSQVGPIIRFPPT
jgi:hypothetical protein